MPTLFEKIYGIEAAATVANSLGDVMEGLRWDEIEQTYGLVTELLPQPGKWGARPVMGYEAGSQGYAIMEQEWGYPFIWHVHDRPPGQGEDGHERHRLAVSAIIRKRGRISIEDLARTWISDIDPANFGYLLGPQDQVIYYGLKAGVFPWDVGRYATFPGMIGTSKMMVAIGIINAGDPRQAALDAHDVGRIKDVRGPRDNYSLEVAAAIAAATAEGLKTTATVDSIIDVALAQLTRVPRAEVEQALTWAREVESWKDLRPLFQDRYEGHWMSNAVEILSGGLAVFLQCGGDVEKGIIHAVNMGRDTDCRAYVAGSLAAALQGIDGVPERWVTTVSEQVVDDPYTVSRRTPLESATGLYEALMASVDKTRARIADIDAQLGSPEER
ncbi:ADP-ribosylglycohydrolase family protein [Microbacterium sp. ET2]|uniref:ADP-ribosylglycohydrolase family protein n=1 Tax=Microbacterium albipurpureum TaxID=3050384 RepID=UPI00259CA3C8|nr:ADP-ribosylglycohydrolase family protein [Microbacterium sp. ET2 (Ac-2212)]WJL96962.1 ADP-ribosylglycohydrolase family protein [Microbacterium sp. ET2 (Ac-2212)]